MYEDYEKLIEGIIRRLSRYNQNADPNLLRKAFHFSYDAHQNQLRKSGDPYFVHPLEVAKILFNPQSSHRNRVWHTCSTSTTG